MRSHHKYRYGWCTFRYACYGPARNYTGTKLSLRCVTCIGCFINYLEQIAWKLGQTTLNVYLLEREIFWDICVKCFRQEMDSLPNVFGSIFCAYFIKLYNVIFCGLWQMLVCFLSMCIANLIVRVCMLWCMCKVPRTLCN